MDDNDNDNLVPFLRGIADDIENKTILLKQLNKVHEFFISYKFQEQAIKDNDQTLNNDEKRKFNKEDFFKFLILGWHIYCCIIKDKPISDIDDID